MKIGFIGLGNMGAPMAKNLAKNGLDVLGFDTDNSIKLPEITMMPSIPAILNEVDIVFTMLPSGLIVKEIVSEFINNFNAESTLIDCSTIDVKTTKEVCQTLSNKKVNMLDAPVSGGVQGAKSGSLTFMVGGSRDDFDQLRFLFEYMGSRSVYCGENGSGQTAKICNNMILGVTMIATCEAFALADKLELDREAMFDVVSTSSGYSWSMNSYCPAPGVGPKAPSDNNYIPGFSSDLMLKDLMLSQNAASETKASTPMGDLAMTLYKDFVENKNGSGLDFSAILKTFEV
ncbi:MAG: 3-hydroxyisobutyrate dehydrogenase [Paracoccaceae bacterium]|uniref:3-hydroxyisobutyrate dehydrogenase n=1 Tax=Candidatus Salinivivens marinus TaxID=3381703 RepID=UPI000BDFDFE8|nr:MAG: 3-hydroxyisobutyrate dehydrogenase [Rhodobacteraceae bacterium MED-G08]